jgi:hypothetical protein
VQRSAVATDEQRRLVRERSQLRQVEFAAPDDALGRDRARRSRACCATPPAAALSDGPDVMTIRRSGASLASAAATSANAAAGQRRNGFPALTCRMISVASGGTRAAASRARTRCFTPGSASIVTGSL